MDRLQGIRHRIRRIQCHSIAYWNDGIEAVDTLHNVREDLEISLSQRELRRHLDDLIRGYPRSNSPLPCIRPEWKQWGRVRDTLPRWMGYMCSMV